MTDSFEIEEAGSIDNSGLMNGRTVHMVLETSGGSYLIPQDDGDAATGLAIRVKYITPIDMDDHKELVLMFADAEDATAMAYLMVKSFCSPQMAKEVKQVLSRALYETREK